MSCALALIYTAYAVVQTIPRHPQRGSSRNVTHPQESKTMNRVYLCTLAATLAATSLARSAEVDSEGWINLFDGKSLAGWKASEHPEQWKIDDGRIVASGPRSHLFYLGDDPAHPAEFENFHFKADVMTTPGSNSGIYFHTRFQESGWPQIGFEAQVNNTHGDPVKTASIYHIVKNFVPPAEDNEWFTEEVIVKGKNIVTKVNGKIVCDYTEPAGVTGPMEKVNKGTFALQAHDPKSTTYYRNLKVKPLKK